MASARASRRRRPGPAGRPGTVGVTLVELLVVIVLLSVLSGIVVAAWNPPPTGPAGFPADPLSALRRTAITTGRSAAGEIPGDSGTAWVRALVDGRIVADEKLPVEMLTGRRVPTRSPSGTGR